MQAISSGRQSTLKSYLQTTDKQTKAEIIAANMTNIVVVTKILFLTLIAHSFVVIEQRSVTAVPSGASAATNSGAGSGVEEASKNEDDDNDDDGALVLVSSQEHPKGAQKDAAGPLPVNNAKEAAADLCYLSDGGSSMTLAINEATPLGSIVGTVEVNGDPTPETGNIELVDTPFEQSPLEPLASAASTTTTNKQGSNGRLFGRGLPRPGVQSTVAPLLPTSGGFYSLLTGSSPSSSSQVNHGAALKLAPGTRNLILVRPLDKEGSEGEQSTLGATLHCRPRLKASSADVGTASRIPIRILITDANDHAPEFQSAPYVINISETAPVGAVASRDIRAEDKDAAGPHSTLHYKVLDDGSVQSQVFAFESPLEPTLLVAQPLDFESQQVPTSFNITIVATDQSDTEPLSGATQVRVNILDFDDQNPRFLDEKYTLVMDESQQSSVGQALRVWPNHLRAEDGDKGINAPIRYSFEPPLPSIELQNKANTEDSTSGSTSDKPSNSVERYLHLSASSGELKLLRQWPLQWSGAPMTLVVRATQQDNRDRYALTTLSIVAKASTGMQKSSSAASSKPIAPSPSPPMSMSNSARSSKAASGIEFVPSNQVSASVSEDAPLNERIAQVRARLIDQFPATTTTTARPTMETQVVDLINEQAHNNNGGGGWSLAVKQRPISYQILDEPSDHFGISSTGDLYLKRALDYEQKQEYKFRVLATHTKHSDICHVHVSVVNTNDNKPKFTLPQYTFHLSESRLRNSNVIGNVHATDNDLNDTVQYHLVGAHCVNGSSGPMTTTTTPTSSQQPIDLSNLFELSPATGQLALKQVQAGNGVAQNRQLGSLNATTCHLVVHANDSLGPQASRHSQTARITLHVAPALIGRSLSDLRTSPALPVQSSSLDKARSLTTTSSSNNNNQDAAILDDNNLIVSAGEGVARGAGSGSTHHSWRQNRQQQVVAPVVASQRSSVATVVASLQHMARSVSFLEMPMSTALVLAALLAFLVCLLIIVIVSMSVHVYRRSRLKTLSRRRRQHLSAAAQLRNHAHLSAAMAAASVAAARAASAGSSRSGSASGRVSVQATPTAKADPRSSALSNQRAPMPSQQHCASDKSSRSSPTNSTRAGSSPSSVSRGRVGTGKNPPDTCCAPANTKPLNEQLLQLSSLTTGGSSSMAASPLSMTTTSARLSKRSYQSHTTDDSSVMHCGHYSVANAAGQATPLQSSTPRDEYSSSSARWRSQQLDPEKTARHAETTIDQLKSYRKLPLMDSLARSTGFHARNSNKVSPVSQEINNNNSFSAIAIKAAADNLNSSNDSSLMAMVRDQRSQLAASRPEVARAQFTSGSLVSSGTNGTASVPAPMPAIKWPPNAFPQRVKRLTWDDELSSSEIGSQQSASNLGEPGGSQLPAETARQKQYSSRQQLFLFAASPESCTRSEANSPASLGSPVNNNAKNAQTTSDGSASFRAAASQQQLSNQNNHLDYTIVQSCQFSADSLALAASVKTDDDDGSRQVRMRRKSSKVRSLSRTKRRSKSRDDDDGESSSTEDDDNDDNRVDFTYSKDQDDLNRRSNLQLMTTAVL